MDIDTPQTKAKPMGYRLEKFDKLYRLTQFLVTKEINFSHTVMFNAEINLTQIEKIRAQSPDKDKPTYTGFVAKAVAQALKEFPYANRRLVRVLGLPFCQRLQSFDNTDIAVAIEREVEGYHAVAYMEILGDVQNQSLEQITSLLREFSQADLESSAQWRAFYNLGMRVPTWLGGWIAYFPTLVPRMWQKYRGGAAMISSPSKYGVDGIVTAWTHPLGFSYGLAQKKALVVDDQVVAVRAFTFAMNWDRRVMAGAQAARFFARICELLRQPTV